MSFLILAALVALVPVSTHAHHACNGTFPAYVTTQHFQGKCYAFISYHYSDYSQASKTCEYYGGSLAIVNSSEINTALTQVLNETIDSHLKFWIGLNDLEMEGVYRWEDGSLMDYENFEDGHDPRFDNYDDCVAMDYHGLWYLYKCSSSTQRFEAAKHFICEFPEGDESHYEATTTEMPTMTDIPSQNETMVMTNTTSPVPVNGTFGTD